MPMADKFFQARSGTDEATQRAMNAMADGLRGDLGQVTAAHAGLYQKLEEQSGQLAALAAESLAARAAAEAANRRVSALELQLKRILVLVSAVLVVGLVALAFVVRIMVAMRPH